MNHNINKVLLDILRKCFCENDIEINLNQQYNSDLVACLYAISKAQDLAHIAGSALLDAGVEMDEVLRGKFQKAITLSMYRYATMDYELEQIYGTLDKAKIPYMPLKGSVIRKYYPKPEMRTSCDIDILIHPEDISAAVSVLEQVLNYKTESRNVHDVTVIAPSGVHVELHFSLTDGDSKFDWVFADLWKEELREEESYRYRMSDDLFIAYHFIHMAQHFRYGGCGIRPILDSYLLRLNMDFSSAYVILDKVGLKRFAESIMQLVDVWFNGKEHNALTAELENYIFFSGVYGSNENKAAISQHKNKSKLKYALGRIFLPYGRMVNYYPFLKKCPILLPFYYIKRMCRLLSPQTRKAAAGDLKQYDTVSGEKQQTIVDLYHELDLM